MIAAYSKIYTDRKIDLHIMQGIDPPNKSAITPSFGKLTNFCTGVQKLVQRYVISLLTELTSQPTFTDFGTALVSTLTATSSRFNQADIYPIFNAANAKVKNEFKQYDILNQPPLDERLLNAELVSVLAINGGVNLNINIKTFSQTDVTFVLPLPV